jgi:glucokinase
VPDRGNGEAIGIDVGGTKINAFRVTRDGTVAERTSRPTPANDEAATLSAMVELARSLLTPDVIAVGVGAAGMIDSKEGVLGFAPNLAWRNLPIAERMRDALGLPCQVDNDASMAAYGEFRFGAGRGYRHLLLVTVGTGLGGGIVSDGRLFRGANGFASEIGHIIVEPGGPLCGCGNRGCWEQVAAGRAIDRERGVIDKYSLTGRQISLYFQAPTLIVGESTLWIKILGLEVIGGRGSQVRGRYEVCGETCCQCYGRLQLVVR